jgi:PTS system fructose-specific IIA component/PTS system nitrogen regulatory IIA component
MKLKDFIVADAIVPALAATTRDEAIGELVASLARAGTLEASAVDEIVAALVKREKNGSTGFGKGVAVPHVKHPAVKKMAGTVGCSEAGLDFAALDSQPVYSIFPAAEPRESAAGSTCRPCTSFSPTCKRTSSAASCGRATAGRRSSELLDEADAEK